MNASLGGFVLFLHIGVVIAAFAVAAILHAALHTMVRARTVEELRPSAALVHRLEPLLPILAIFIFVFGAWLIHLEDLGWGEGWIDTAIVALVVIEGLAGALLAPRSKQLIAAIDAAPPGPLSPELHTATMDPRIWDLAHVATFGFLGVVYVMADKPSGGLAAAVVVLGVLVGLALSRWQLSLAPKTIGAPVGAAA